MPALKHIHTYERSKLNKNTYRCVDPRCTSFARKELLVGKVAMCPQCEQEIVLTPALLDLAKVICDECRKDSRGKRRLRKNLPLLQNLFPESKPHEYKIEKAPEELFTELDEIIKGAK